MSANNITILVVDDETALCNSIADILRYDGYHVSIASNGYEALEILNSTNIDLIITDVLMPEMDGLELSKKVLQWQPEQQIVLISDGGRLHINDYDYRNVAKKLTRITYTLSKPFKPEALLHLVQQISKEI